MQGEWREEVKKLAYKKKQKMNEAIMLDMRRGRETFGKQKQEFLGESQGTELQFENLFILQTKEETQEELKGEEQEGEHEQEQEGMEEQEQKEGVQEEEGVRVELLDRELWHQFRNNSRS